MSLLSFEHLTVHGQTDAPSLEVWSQNIIHLQQKPSDTKSCDITKTSDVAMATQTQTISNKTRSKQNMHAAAGRFCHSKKEEMVHAAFTDIQILVF